MQCKTTVEIIQDNLDTVKKKQKEQDYWMTSAYDRYHTDGAVWALEAVFNALKKSQNGCSNKKCKVCYPNVVD